jgi:hypothetical protein
LQLKVLGIDVASAEWSSIGNAVITFDSRSQTFQGVQAGVIRWPTAKLTASVLANALKDYARRNGVCAIALDGPQGWRDPGTPEGTPGVGRRCEYESRTQAKTGVYPMTFPGNQRPWIEFCIDVFAELLEAESVFLADPTAPRSAPSDGYLLVECNPTSAWRASDLVPLPGKSKRPQLEPYLVSLARTFGLPPIAASVTRHDDVQAVVAAIVATAVVGGPAFPISTGVPSTIANDRHGVRRRVEGFIWNVRPLIATGRHQQPSEPVKQHAVPAVNETGAQARVTQWVVDQIGRSGVHQTQIALRNVPGGTKTAKVTVVLGLDGEEYELIVGDSHAAWRSHQGPTTIESFDRLFAFLADRAGVWHSIAYFRTASEMPRGSIPKPTAKATYERARRLANIATWSVHLQCRRLESTEPEDVAFVLRRWTDFDFLIVALVRLRRAAQLAADIPELKSALVPATTQFDDALPGLKSVRDVAEHIDEYALDQGRRKSVARQSLEVSTIEAEGPTLHWLETRLNAREALQASEALFAAVKEAVRLFEAPSNTDDKPASV